MSQFFDDLARTLAQPMPRRRALRLAGGALVAAAVPLARPKLHAARAAGRSRLSGVSATGCGDPGTCSNPLYPKVCGCDFLAGCYRDCCAPTDVCCKFPPPGSGGPPCEKACCPKGSRCGTGRRGDPACITNRCEQAGSASCGKECCDDATETCVDPSRSLCCKKEDARRFCVILAAAGSGQRGGAGECCPAARPNCCANDKRKACCEKPGCCAGRCCPAPKICKDDVCKCPEKTKTCGPDCCKKGKKPEKCCNGKKCCKQTEECCGESCCDTPNGDYCSQGKCCPKGTVNCGGKGKCCDKVDCCNGKCCEGDELCVNGTCCPPSRAFGTGASARCCPPGTVPTRAGPSFRCCPRAIPDCCGEDAGGLPCLPGTFCVSGACRRL